MAFFQQAKNDLEESKHDSEMYEESIIHQVTYRNFNARVIEASSVSTPQNLAFQLNGVILKHSPSKISLLPNTINVPAVAMQPQLPCKSPPDNESNITRASNGPYTLELAGLATAHVTKHAADVTLRDVFLERMKATELKKAEETRRWVILRLAGMGDLEYRRFLAKFSKVHLERHAVRQTCYLLQMLSTIKSRYEESRASTHPQYSPLHVPLRKEAVQIQSAPSGANLSRLEDAVANIGKGGEGGESGEDAKKEYQNNPGRLILSTVGIFRQVRDLHFSIGRATVLLHIMHSPTGEANFVKEKIFYADDMKNLIVIYGDGDKDISGMITLMSYDPPCYFSLVKKLTCHITGTYTPSRTFRSHLTLQELDSAGPATKAKAICTPQPVVTVSQFAAHRRVAHNFHLSLFTFHFSFSLRLLRPQINAALLHHQTATISLDSRRLSTYSLERSTSRNATMAGKWAKPHDWYDTNNRPTRAEDYAVGLGLTMETYNDLKEDIERVALKVKPEGTNFKGNKTHAKKAVVAEFCRNMPQLDTARSSAPEVWFEYVVQRLIGVAHSNASRRKKLGISTVPAPTEAKRRAQATPFKPQNSSELTESVTQTLHSPPLRLPRNQDATCSAPVHKEDLLIEVKIETMDFVELVSVKQILTGEGQNASLELLTKQLQSCEELPDLSKATYIASWNNQNAAVRSDAAFNAILCQSATNGERAVEFTVRPSRSSNNCYRSDINQPNELSQDAPAFGTGTIENCPKESSYSPSSLLRQRLHSPRASPQPSIETQSHDAQISLETPSVRRTTPFLSKDISNERPERPRFSRAKRTMSRTLSDEQGRVERSPTKRPRTRSASTHKGTWDSTSGPSPSIREDNVFLDRNEESRLASTASSYEEGSDSEEESSLVSSAKNYNEMATVDDEMDSTSAASSATDSSLKSDPMEDLDDVLSGSEHDPEDDSDEFDDDVSEAERHERNKEKFVAQLFQEGLVNLDGELARVQRCMLDLIQGYFPLIDYKALAKSDGIVIPNWGLNPDFKISPYQLASATWAFHRERATPCPGGIYADEPGGGKTIQSLTHFLINYFHNENTIEVEDARARGDKSHLPKSQSPDAKCPSAAKQPLACSCEAGNRDIYRFGPQRGITITLTPNAGLRSFQNDARLMLKGGKIMEREFPPRVAIHADKFNKDDFTGALTDEEVSATCKAVDWSMEEQWETDNRTKQVGKTMQTQSWTNPTFSGPRACDPEATAEKAPRRSARVNIVTTRGCLVGRVASKYITTRETHWKWQTQAKGTTRTFTRNLMQVGCIFWDECHQDNYGQTIPAFIKDTAREYREVYNRSPALWGMSGTPDNGKPMEPLKFLTMGLRSKEWDDVDTNSEFGVLRNLTQDSVNQMAKDFDRLCEKAKTNPALATHDFQFRTLVVFIRKVVPTFFIRRGESTRWFDSKPVIPKASELYLDMVQCQANTTEAEILVRLEGKVKAERRRKYQELVAVWESNGSDANQKPKMPSSVKSQSYHTARVAASVAQIVEHWEGLHPDNGPDDEESRSCSKADEHVGSWVRDPLGSAFTKVLANSGFRQNAKIKCAKGICNSIRKLKRQDGTRCKVLIATRNPLVLAAWKNELSQTYGKESIVLYETGMNNAKKSQALETFGNDESKWIILCTFRSVGVGLNIQRANHAILIEPSHKYSDMQQLFGRIDRRGQKEPRCYGYVLVNAASAIEKRMVNSTEFTKRLEQSVYRDPKDLDDLVETVQAQSETLGVNSNRDCELPPLHLNNTWLAIIIRQMFYRRIAQPHQHLQDAFPITVLKTSFSYTTAHYPTAFEILRIYQPQSHCSSSVSSASELGNTSPTSSQDIAEILPKRASLPSGPMWDSHSTESQKSRPYRAIFFHVFFQLKPQVETCFVSVAV
ncbi:uncharacterized protein BDR25DRAFT_362161 [Lindgomyces ingoldianus]|uniref:Uncharacterized protein n=1 Tax=Lindgomyces ingoldianus TaxID=673940 RepID=A0ACB6QC56_9PLEO|nr:uncharacterized protein BDR25DRAFT_362161 [Lindgomyces ingoldianus]KAF2463962.1 hypothetical protein BDR25DRAFT_362161 [Lindgomyces ingoldianus]